MTRPGGFDRDPVGTPEEQQAAIDSLNQVLRLKKAEGVIGSMDRNEYESMGGPLADQLLPENMTKLKPPMEVPEIKEAVLKAREAGVSPGKVIHQIWNYGETGNNASEADK